MGHLQFWTGWLYGTERQISSALGTAFSITTSGDETVLHTCLMLAKRGDHLTFMSVLKI
jgi:hypothetical protein